MQMYRAEDWESYRMDYQSPHGLLEPLENEIAVVDAALDAPDDMLGVVFEM